MARRVVRFQGLAAQQRQNAFGFRFVGKLCPVQLPFGLIGFAELLDHEPSFPRQRAPGDVVRAIAGAVTAQAAIVLAALSVIGCRAQPALRRSAPGQRRLPGRMRIDQGFQRRMNPGPGFEQSERIGGRQSQAGDCETSASGSRNGEGNGRFGACGQRCERQSLRIVMEVQPVAGQGVGVGKMQAEHGWVSGEYGRSVLSREDQSQQVAVGVIHGQEGRAAHPEADHEQQAVAIVEGGQEHDPQQQGESPALSGGQDIDAVAFHTDGSGDRGMAPIDPAQHPGMTHHGPGHGQGTATAARISRGPMGCSSRPSSGCRR